MIVVTGATGALNGATVDHLLERLPASEIAVAVRDTSKAARFARRGVEVRRGDYADPDSLPAAFAGADQLLLVSSNDPTASATTRAAPALRTTMSRCGPCSPAKTRRAYAALTWGSPPTSSSVIAGASP